MPGGSTCAASFFHPVQRRAGGHTRRRHALHLGRRIEIVARHAIRDRRIPQLGDRSDRHHLAAGVARLQAHQVLPVAPEPAVGLGDHLVRSAQEIEVVDVLRAEIDLQRVEHVGRRQPDLLGLQAVDIGIDRG